MKRRMCTLLLSLAMTMLLVGCGHTNGSSGSGSPAPGSSGRQTGNATGNIGSSSNGTELMEGASTGSNEGQSWLYEGMSMGSAASFMLTGPATKITNLGALKILLGIKRFVLYLVFVMAFSFLTGMIVNVIV